METQWKRIWRPLIIPVVLLMLLGVYWYRLKMVHELLPPPVVKQRLELLCKKNNVPFPPPSTRLVIRKADRTASLYSGEQLLKTFPIALGRDPIGPKKLAADGKTPEGNYVICEKIPRATFHLYLGLNYPNQADAISGFNENRLTLRQREDILFANKRLLQLKTHAPAPPSTTPLGGNIGIHGGGTRNDWTKGNIALSDGNIEEIFYTLKLKSPVQILP